MTTNIPSNTPLQQQIDEFIAEGQAGYPPACCGICSVQSDSSSPPALPSGPSGQGCRHPISRCSMHEAPR
jgi:hypothetical protein